MNFLTTALALISAVAGTAAAAGSVTLSALSTDTLDTGSFGTSVYYANSSLYIGGIQTKPYAEKLILSASDDFFKYTTTSSGVTQISGNSTFSFTSKNSSPTGWQNVLLYPGQSKPVAFTIPHSGAVPDGAEMAAFTNTVFPAGKKLLNYQGQEGNWVLKKVDAELEVQTYQVYWQGGEAVEGGEFIAITVHT